MIKRSKRGTILVGAIMFLAAGASVAQSWRGRADLEVRVSSRKGGDLAGARVELMYRDGRGGPGPAPVATDGKGRAVILGLADGVWQVEVKHPEYMSFVAVVRLAADEKPQITASFLEASASSSAPIQVKLLKARGGPASPPLPVAAAAPAPAPTAAEPAPPVAPAPEHSPTPAVQPAAPEPQPMTPPTTEPAAAQKPQTPPARPAIEPEMPAPLPAPEVSTPRSEGSSADEAPALAMPEPTPPAVEAPAAETAPEPMVAPTVEPPTPEPTHAAPPPPALLWRSYRQRTCPECRPGEWAVTIAARLGGGACDETTTTAAGEGLAMLGARAELELANFAGSVGEGAELVTDEAATQIAARLATATSGGCRLLGVALPRNGRFVGFQYEHESATGRRPCLPDQQCPGSDVRFSGPPRITRGAAATLLHTLASGSDGLALMTVFFRAPNDQWTPQQ